MSSPRETVLLYNIQPESRRQQIEDLLSRLGMTCQVIPPDANASQLGSLLELKGFPPVSLGSAPLPAEMMILSGFSDLRLDTLLKSFRRSGIPSVALKAIVTDTNVHWTLNTLFGHLLLEHRQMHA